MGLIRLNDDWCIIVDDYNYALAVDTHREYVRKNGNVEHKYDFKGYYGSLEGALMAFSDKMVREVLQDGERSLSEALRCVIESNERVQELIREACRGGETNVIKKNN